MIGAIAGDIIGSIYEGKHAKSKNVDLILFPELALTGYPPEDLLLKIVYWVILFGMNT